jgi:hypothetical protein
VEIEGKRIGSDRRLISRDDVQESIASPAAPASWTPRARAAKWNTSSAARGAAKSNTSSAARRREGINGRNVQLGARRLTGRRGARATTTSCPVRSRPPET